MNENGTMIIRGNTEDGDYSTFVVHEEKPLENGGIVKYFAKE